jgi:trehalose 6-phosphate phosphatase
MGGSRLSDVQQLIPTARLEGRPLLILLDVDGTLAPIAANPSLARVPDVTRQIIASLVAARDVFVVLVSGRAAADARRLVGVDRVWTVGNHGAEVMDPDGGTIIDAAVARYAETVAEMARTLEPLVGRITGAILENKVWTLSVHYRGVDDADVPRLREFVERTAVEFALRVTEGKKVLEVRPPVNVDKGTGIARVARELGAVDDRAAILFAGDDVTDEDAFRYLRAHYPRAVTIYVGDQQTTAAEFRFTTLDQVRDVLGRISREVSEAR